MHSLKETPHSFLIFTTMRVIEDLVNREVIDLQLDKNVNQYANQYNQIKILRFLITKV